MPAAVLTRFAGDRSAQEDSRINPGESTDFLNLAFRQNTLRFGRHRDPVFRAVVVQTPARFHYASPDIDWRLRRRVEFRKPARVVVMPVRQYDIRGRIKFYPHSGGVRDQCLARTRIEQDPASVRFEEERQPEFGHVSRFGEGIDKAVNRGGHMESDRLNFTG